MATRQHTLDLRNALLDAARDLISEIGYTRMSHADIAAAVGIARTTFYEHFSSKEDVLVELVRRDLPPMIDDLISKVDRTLPPPQRLASLARVMVRFVGTDHIGLILHTDVPHLTRASQLSISEAHKGVTAEFADVYREGVDKGMFKSMPPRFVGIMIEQIIMAGGTAVMEAKDPCTEAEQIAQDTADLLVAAFTAVDR